MSSPIPIGVDDFRVLRERGMVYVDKTDLIRGVLDKGAQALLLARPRRFGKTLNLNMLRCFFEKRPEDLSPLFEGLSIWSAGQAYRAHFQRYPVLALSFKDVQAHSWELAWRELRDRIAQLFDEQQWLLTIGALTDREAREFREILAGSAHLTVYQRALLDLSRILRRSTGERVVILIDDYDCPLQAAQTHGYASEAASFFRSFLGTGLKGNPHLFKAVLMGVLLVAKESVFSDLNNLAIFSLLHPDFSANFGFTEVEVASLLEARGRGDRLSAIRSWYGGYDCGGTALVNPWSILNYLDRPELEPRAFWTRTGNDTWVRNALPHHAASLRQELETLLDGGSVLQRLEENTALSTLNNCADTLFEFLVFGGYLRAEKRIWDPEDEPHYSLSIPNREVRPIYASILQEGMTDPLGAENGRKRIKEARLTPPTPGVSSGTPMKVTLT